MKEVWEENVYKESDIRKAIRYVNQVMTTHYEKLSFHDMLLIENVLTKLEMELFCGAVCEKDVDTL